MSRARAAAGRSIKTAVGAANNVIAFYRYNKALHLYRKGDAAADQVLMQAIKSNEYVYPYLSGEEILPYRMPDYYSPGKQSEAVIYAIETKKAWENTPGALPWVEQML